MSFLEIISRILVDFVVFAIGLNLLFYPKDYVYDWDQGLKIFQIDIKADEAYVQILGALIVFLIILTLIFSVKKINYLLVLLFTTTCVLFYNPFINRNDINSRINLSLIAALLLQERKIENRGG